MFSLLMVVRAAIRRQAVRILENKVRERPPTHSVLVYNPVYLRHRTFWPMISLREVRMRIALNEMARAVHGVCMCSP